MILAYLESPSSWLCKGYPFPSRAIGPMNLQVYLEPQASISRRSAMCTSTMGIGLQAIMDPGTVGPKYSAAPWRTSPQSV